MSDDRQRVLGNALNQYAQNYNYPPITETQAAEKLVHRALKEFADDYSGGADTSDLDKLLFVYEWLARVAKGSQA